MYIANWGCVPFCNICAVNLLQWLDRVAHFNPQLAIYLTLATTAKNSFPINLITTIRAVRKST